MNQCINKGILQNENHKKKLLDSCISKTLAAVYLRSIEFTDNDT